MRRVLGIWIFALALIAAGVAFAQPQTHPTAGRPASTPEEMARTYATLADGILALNRTEWNMVNSILAVTYGHARSAYDEARARLDAGMDCRGELETLAALVSQLGNEGDAAVAGVRKRLLEGGHHHNAKGEEMGLYDEGFVIVTRKARKVFLDAAGEIGKMAGSPDAARLEAQWKTVAGQFRSLMAEAKG
jgi:hypothetical protein